MALCLEHVLHTEPLHTSSKHTLEWCLQHTVVRAFAMLACAGCAGSGGGGHSLCMRRQRSMQIVDCRRSMRSSTPGLSGVISMAMRFGARVATVLAALFVAVMVASAPVSAQEGPNGAINPSRDCQTVLTCNFSRKGAVRGCLSSYSCRQCRFVKSRCQVGARRGVCERLVCDWGA